MKEVLLMAVVLLANVSGYCQKPHKVYCELLGRGNIYGITGKVQVYFGKPYATLHDKNTYIVGNDYKPVKFVSMIEAVNYMSDLGWSLFTAYQACDKYGAVNVIAYHYIMTKEVTDDNQIKAGIKLKE